MTSINQKVFLGLFVVVKTVRITKELMKMKFVTVWSEYWEYYEHQVGLQLLSAMVW